MKKIILFGLLGFLVWLFYPLLSTTSIIDNSFSESAEIDNTEFASKTELQLYQCDGRQHCSQMNSYEEAKYFIENCPDTKMDGDLDGIPCERQFNRYD